MKVEGLDWQALERLRARFLAGQPGRGPYWESDAELAAYDATFGERIGWKWDAVLRELHRRQWAPPTGGLVDFGCGSGVAHRRVLGAYPRRFRTLTLIDASRRAVQYSALRLRQEFPDISVSLGDAAVGELGTLIISHVLNELNAVGRRELAALARRAQAILWVEPGTHADSRALVEQRERLLAEGGWTAVAPCPHGGRCGLLEAVHERHWCHFFAHPPAGLAQDGDWARFARRAGVDIAAIPLSFLILSRDGGGPAPGGLRALGRPRRRKGVVQAWVCGGGGLEDLQVQTRREPEVAAALEDGDAEMPLIWRAAPAGQGFAAAGGPARGGESGGGLNF